jgi:hypothetical protein
MKKEFEKKRRAALANARKHDQDFAKYAADVSANERASKEKQKDEPPKQQ